jgi:hypothetical protein
MRIIKRLPYVNHQPEKAMKELLNVLAGMGSALNAFGSVPQYDVPSRGDQARDFALIGRDFQRVTARVEKHANKALTERNGTTNNRAGEE